VVPQMSEKTSSKGDLDTLIDLGRVIDDFLLVDKHHTPKTLKTH
jgi:hypothetical protein